MAQPELEALSPVPGSPQAGRTARVFGPDDYRLTAVELEDGRSLTPEELATFGAKVEIVGPGKAYDQWRQTADFHGGDDDDVLVGADGKDTLSGGDGDDTLYGKGGDDTLYGYGNDDELYGGDGNDKLWGGFDADSLYGESGEDSLYGESGNDVLHGGDNNDTIYGAENDDDLYGDGGDDKLYGGKGDDGLYGGVGTDELTGGENQDRFLYFNSGELVDDESEDAKIEFKNDGATWTESEVEEVDQALAVLHRFTGNDNLLETESGGKLTLKRGAGSSDFGVNSGGGNITFYDPTFDGVGSAYATVFVSVRPTASSNWRAGSS